jgi:PilZ domain-containing protein
MKHLPRENQRVYITFYLRVFEGDNFLGFLIDIAKNGLKLISDNPLQPEKFYQIRMNLPSTLEWDGKKIKDKQIQYTAECLWSKPDNNNSDFYVSGFKFTDLSEEENGIIYKLIHQYKLK